jgi:hypothetical protein
MIVEFPAFYCTLTTKRVLRLRMQAARRAFIRACGLPPSSDFKRLRGTATTAEAGLVKPDGACECPSLKRAFGVPLSR